MKRSLLFPLLALCACSSGIKDAEERLAIVKKSGDKQAICREQRAVQEAYLRAKDQTGYDVAKVSADLACADAQNDPYPGIEPDNMQAM